MWGLPCTLVHELMQDSYIDLDRVPADAERVATVLPAAHAFGPFSRTFVVPTGWMAMTDTSSGGSVLHEAGRPVHAAGVHELLLVRATPFHVNIAEDDLATADEYACRALVQLCVRLIEDAGDLKSFRRTVLGTSDRADVRMLARYLSWQCRRALTEAAAKRPACDLLDGKDRETISALVHERLKAMLFAAGMTLHQPPDVRFECAGYREVRRQQGAAARRRDEIAAREVLEEAAAEARRRQLAEIEAVLAEAQSLAARTPGVTLSNVIRTFAESQRGQLYRGLWMLPAADARTQWIVAVAGNELLCFDPNLPDAPARWAGINGPAGALRSARYTRLDGRPTILVGAARGVYVVGVDDLKARATYTLEPPDGRELRGGVNAVAVAGGRVFGTHSEVGLIGWNPGRHDEPEFPLSEWARDARTVRAVQIVGKRIVLSVDEHVLTCPIDDVSPRAITPFRGSIARITCIHALGDSIFAGNEVGDIWQWRQDAPTEGRCIRRGGGSPIESLQIVTAGGVPHLIVAERRVAALQAVAIDDSFALRYETGGPGVRRCAAGGGVFVAINDLRDRLICWHPAQPEQPYAVIPVSASVGHSVQDVCLVTEEPA